MRDFPRSKLSSPKAPAPDVEDRRLWASLRAKMFGDQTKTTIGRFELRERLGAGAHGIVYRVFDPTLHREAALKYVPAKNQGRGADLERRLEEARAVARVQHPNLLAVYDAGEFEDGLWIAMELVEGGTLRSWLADDARTLPEILRVFIALADGLQHAHERGLSHGDFKPDNVLVELPEGSASVRPRIVDFGLAQSRTQALPPRDAGSELKSAAESSLDTSTISTQRDVQLGDHANERTIHVRGTPAYMAPELFRGDAANDASDQFAYCVTLYEALFGSRPFTGATRTELARRVLEGAREPASTDGGDARVSLPPAWLVECIDRGLQADPDARWANMAALRAELERGLQRIEAPPRRPRSRLAWVVGTGALFLGGIALWRAGSTPDPEPTAAQKCELAGARAEALWDAQRRSKVEQRFAEVEVRFRSEAVASIADRLVDWQRQWSAARVELCVDESNAVEGAMPASDGISPAEVFDFRKRCLDEQAAQLEGFVSALERAQGDGPTLASAVDGSASLPHPSGCDDGPELRSALLAQRELEAGRQVGEGLDPEARDRFRVETESLRGASNVRVTDEIVASARELVSRLEETKGGQNSAPHLRAQLLLGQLLARHGDHDAALEVAKAGFHVAVGEHLQQEAARLALLAHWIGAELKRDPAVVEVWGPLAAAHVAAVSDPPELHAAQLEYTAIAAIVDGRGAEAVPLLREVLGIRQETVGLRDTAYRTYNNLASAYNRSGKAEEAFATMGEARDEIERVLGTFHPDTGSVYNNYGTFATNLGHYTEADEALAKALEIKRETVGAEHPTVGSTFVNIAYLREMQKRYDDAIESYAAAKSIYTSALGSDHLRLGTLLFNEAILFTTLERYEDAQKNFEEFTRIQLVHHPEDHADVLVGQMNSADIRVRRGEAEAGLKELERIAAVSPSSPMHPLDRATLEGSLARANAALGHRAAFDEHYAEHRRICADEYSGSECLDASLAEL